MKRRIREIYGNLRREERFRPLRIGLAFGTILLGIAGIFLPILQGFLLIFLGMSLLAGESRRVRRFWTWVCWHLNRFRDWARSFLPGRWGRSGPPEDDGLDSQPASHQGIR